LDEIASPSSRIAPGMLDHRVRLGEKGKTHQDAPQELTFDDVIDIVNPLQHLPVISTVYRAVTGDEIKPAMRILGDIGYGGPSGFVSACAQVLFEAIAGKDVGSQVIAMLTGSDGDKAGSQLAARPDASSSAAPNGAAGQAYAAAGGTWQPSGSSR
jgi:hypothetical protein